MKMKNIAFKAFAIGKEINTNLLATHFGIRKNFKWEDTLRLGEQQLTGIIKEPEDKTVVLFSFGSAVFINMVHHEIMDIVTYLKGLDSNLVNPSYDFSDDYSIETGCEEETINNGYMALQELAPYHREILSVILAKSVALEKIEAEIEILLDELEAVINLLKSGRLSARDDKLAQISAQILSFKYNTISSIMLLDKPDIAWYNEKAEELYNNLSHMFELDERYSKVQAKTGTLMDIVQVFTSLAQHKKANTLEWMIIILILIEIVISLVDFFMFKMRAGG